MQAAVTWLLFLIAPFANAVPRPEVDPEFSTRIFAESSYYKTVANYDTDGGDYVRLGNGRSYSLIQGILGVEHWLNEDFSAYLQMGGARAESNDGSFTRTNTQATELIGGIRYLMGRTPFPILAEFSLAYPFNRVNDDTDDVLTNEGTMKIDSSVWMEYWMGRVRPYGRLGFLYQDDGRSSPVYVVLGTSWEPERFSLGGEFYYSKTILDDEFADDRAQRDVVTTQVNGGSWKFYSVNPEIMGLRAVGNIDLSQSMRLGMAYDHTINGEAAAAGWTASVWIELNFGQSAQAEEDSIRRPKVLEKEPEDGDRFQPEPTSYDDTLFQEAKPKVPKPKRKQKKKKPLDVDKALEEVQKSLEN